MSENILDTFRNLLEGYNGEHKVKFERLWDTYQKDGSLEQRLMDGFNQEGVEVTPEQFVEMAGSLEGESLTAFYDGVDSNKELVSGMAAEFDALPPDTSGGDGEGLEGDGDQDGDPGEGVPSPGLTQEDLSKAVADPRYQSDPAYRAEVESSFRSVYGGDEMPADSGPSSGRRLGQMPEGQE